GSWVLGELGTGTSTPAPGPLTPTVDGGYSDGKGIYVIGSGDPSWLLTITVPFVQNTSDCYDASVYTGITLLGAGNTNGAKTYGPVYLRVLTAAVMAKPVAERNFHQVEMDVDNLGIWIIYTYHWADFVQPNAAGAEAPLDPHDIIGLEVIAAGPDIEVAIDEVEFITD
ncbi:MAG TPA: hypothetical protein VM686_16685, partial [Polyangiaceae bacterium]|nr:hypothetical protein [Polyangiaceae bacterium]